MKISEAGIDLIKKFEGCRLLAYRDSVGVLTIGYGHTAGVKLGDKITQEEADKYLLDDAGAAESDVEKLVTAQINQSQFDALVSFTFNIGSLNLAASTLLRLLNDKNYAAAARQFDRWVFAGNVLQKGLVARREAERQLFLS